MNGEGDFREEEEGMCERQVVRVRLTRAWTGLGLPGPVTSATALVQILVRKVGLKVQDLWPQGRLGSPPTPGVTLSARLASALIVHFYGREYLSPGVPRARWGVEKGNVSGEEGGRPFPFWH